MMKCDRNQEGRCPYRIERWSEAEQHDLACLPGDPSQQFAKVETNRGGSIQVEIRMMHNMESPKKRRFVRQHMPEVERVVHEKECHGDLDPDRQSQAPE